MTLLLEKLSRYWQLRFLVVGAGIALIVFAVLLPDPGNKSHDTAIQTVAAAPLSSAASGNNGMETASMVSARTLPASEPLTGGLASVWTRENPEVANQLRPTVESELEADFPTDQSESIRALQQSAERGDPVAEFLLGHAYQLGLGIAKDMTQTAHWYAMAAEPGKTSSGAGGLTASPVTDFTQALEAYRKLAEQGDMHAALYLGLAYDLGRDLPRNAMEAARWYRVAAAKGSVSAASNLGALYANGDGMPKDEREAAVWFRSAADRGSASAQYCLGRVYWKGEGVTQNAGEAASWLMKSAAQGNSSAQMLLSLMYATGKGVPGSTPEAYMWINLASAHEEQARLSRDQIEKVIPNEEIAEGQRLTHDWLAQHGRFAR